MEAAVPLVEHEREGAALALIEEQLPAELVVVFLLRADVEHDVGDRQQAMQLLAVGQVVAVEIGRIDKDLVLERRRDRARRACRIAGPGRAWPAERVVIVDDRIARRRPGERRLGDGAAGQRVEQRRFADAGAAHEHDDEQRPIHLERLRLAIEIGGEPFERGALERGDGVAVLRVEPGAQAFLQLAQRGSEGPEQGFAGGLGFGHAFLDPEGVGEISRWSSARSTTRNDEHAPRPRRGRRD